MAGVAASGLELSTNNAAVMAANKCLQFVPGLRPSTRRAFGTRLKQALAFLERTDRKNMPNDIEKQLSRQLGYLERSCKLFDEGFPDEAIRIAVTIRTLFHDTKNSKSLLSILEIKDKVLIKSACYPEAVVNGHRYFAHDPLTGMDESGKIIPILGSKKKAWLLSANDWWRNSIAVIISPGICVSRRDIVLAAANKDGGAHVDKKYPQKYEYLNRGFWQKKGGWHSEHQFVLLRQFAFEILQSEELTEYTEETENES